MQRIPQRLRTAISKPEDIAMHCQTFCNTTLEAQIGTCREIVNEIKKIIKDRRESPSAKLQALKVSFRQIFHACMMAGNQQFLGYAVKKIMSRLSIMARQNGTAPLETRGAQLFGARDPGGQAASADFLRNLLSFIRIWSDNYGKSTSGYTEYFAVYNSLVQQGVTFPSTEYKSSLAASPDQIRKEKPKHAERPASMHARPSIQVDSGVNQEEIRQTISLLRDLTRSKGADKELMDELVVKLKGLKCLLETEIQVKASSGEINSDLERLFGLNDQAQKALDDYLNLKNEDILGDVEPSRPAMPQARQQHASEDIMNLRFDDSPPKKSSSASLPDKVEVAAVPPQLNSAKSWGSNPMMSGMPPGAINPAMFASMQAGMPQAGADWQTQFLTMQAMMMQQSMLQGGMPPSASFQTGQLAGFDPMAFQSQQGGSSESQSFALQASMQPRLGMPPPLVGLPALDQSAKDKAKLAALLKSEAELTQDNQEINSTIQALEAAHKQCGSSDLVQLAAEIKDADDSLSRLNSELELMKQRGKNATAKVMAMQKKARESIAEADDAKESLDACNDQILSLETKLAQIQSHDANRKSQLGTTLSQISRLEVEHRLITQEVVKLQAAIEETEQDYLKRRQQETASRATLDTGSSMPAQAAYVEYPAPPRPESTFDLPRTQPNIAPASILPTLVDVQEEKPASHNEDSLEIERQSIAFGVESHNLVDSISMTSSNESSEDLNSPVQMKHNVDEYDPFDLDNWK